MISRLLPAKIISSLLLLSIISAPAGGIGIGDFDLNRIDDAADLPTDSSLDLHLKKGGLYSGKILLTNLSDEETNIYLYTADAVPADNGGIAFKGRGSKQTFLASWIQLSEEEIKLEPRQEKTVNFLIMIPPDLIDKQERVAGIIAENAKPVKSNERSQFNLNILQRAALLVSQQIPGPVIKKIDFLKFKKILMNNHSAFELTLKNAGNVRLDTRAKISVADPFGNDVDSLRVNNLGTILPGEREDLHIIWKNPPYFGYFTATAKVTFGDNQTAEKKIGFLIFPWWIPVIAAFLLIDLVLIIRWYLRRWRSQAIKASASPGESKEETT